MALRRRSGTYYGDGRADVETYIRKYSKANGYTATQFAEANCACGSAVFNVLLDDDEGVAVRRCVACKREHPMADGAEHLADATLDECECPCGKEAFEIVIGVALYAGSTAVRWLYLGCRCPACGLTGTYGDWKNEHEDADALLANV
jgi:hypothetical protein